MCFFTKKNKEVLITEYLSVDWGKISRVRIGEFYYYKVHKFGWEANYSNTLETSIRYCKSLTTEERIYLLNKFKDKFDEYKFAYKQPLLKSLNK